jgi:hypothetical protein
VQLLDPREQEHLVVHREPEREGHDEREHVRLDPAGRHEAQEPRQVPVLEHPHEHAERRRDRQHVREQRLDRDHDRAGHEEQQHEGRGGDDAGGPGQALDERVREVHLARGLTGDEHREVGVEVADLADDTAGDRVAGVASSEVSATTTTPGDEAAG